MTERRTDGTSAFNTRTEQRRLLLLDPTRGEERLMEIQQHDGVVVEVAGIPAGLRQAQAGERGVTGGRGRRQGLWCGCPPSPLQYIGLLGGGGGAGPGRSYLQGGRRPRGVACPPSQVGRPPPLGFPTLGTGGGPRGAPQPTSAHGALRDRWPHPVDPRDPSGGPGTNTGDPRNFPGGRNLTSYI